MYGGCFGDDEKAVFAELCEIVEEVVELYREDGKPLPPATAGCGFGDVLREAAAGYEPERQPAG